MKRFILGAALGLISATLSFAQPVIGDSVDVSVAPGFSDGDHTGRLSLTTLAGTYDYWWFCVQDDGSFGPQAAGGYQATLRSISDGWSNQYIGRDTASGTQGLAKQATIIGYILDTYLPWDQAGPDGRFLDFAGDPEVDNDDFYNAFDAISAYVTAMQPFSVAGTGLERTDFATFNPTNPFDNANPGNEARQDLFNSIIFGDGLELPGVAALDTAGFFETYVVQGQYAIVNTREDHQATLVAQDVLVIMGAPVPEPSSSLLALGSALLLVNRRRRA